MIKKLEFVAKPWLLDNLDHKLIQNPTRKAFIAGHNLMMSVIEKVNIVIWVNSSKIFQKSSKLSSTLSLHDIKISKLKLIENEAPSQSP